MEVLITNEPDANGEHLRGRVVPVQGTGTDGYPYTSNDACKDPLNHGLPSFCPICSNHLGCRFKKFRWHSHVAEDFSFKGVFYGRVWHNVRLTISGNFWISLAPHKTNPNRFTEFIVRQEDLPVGQI